MKDKKESYIVSLRKIATGIVASTLIAGGLFLYNANGAIGELLLYDTIPFYNPGDEVQQMFKFLSDSEKNQGHQSDELGAESGKMIKETSNINNASGDERIVYSDGIDIDGYGTDIPSGEINNTFKIEDSFVLNEYQDIIGTEDVIYQDDSHSGNIENHFPTQNITVDNIDKLHDMDYLRSHFYSVDKTTNMTEELFDADKFLSADLTIHTDSSKPKVLIFHTHPSEAFSDSDLDNPNDGIVGVGNRLEKVLKEKYGLNSIHVTTKYDVTNGKSSVTGAYERMEPDIKKTLEENPSIELAIDLHRDGLAESVKLVTEINGKPVAKIMFFNGLSKIINKDGVLEDIDILPNPNLPTNLALSFNMQLAANKLYPGFARKIYLKGYRFSLHMLPKSMLVEVGANTNTKEEAFNAVEPLADIIANVVLKK